MYPPHDGVLTGEIPKFTIGSKAAYTVDGFFHALPAGDSGQFHLVE
jgi:hypothetical protein